jgi:hypothetical protein
MCRYHLWVDKLVKDGCVVGVRETKTFGDRACTCVLKVVSRHPDGMSIIQIAKMLGYHRQWLTDIQTRAVRQLRDHPDTRRLADDFADEGEPVQYVVDDTELDEEGLGIELEP